MVGLGLALARLRPPNWQADGALVDGERMAIQRWARVQQFVRILNNSLICAAGFLIAITGSVPHGKTWLWLWTAILLVLMTCIVLAMVDAISSLAGYKRALPEAARRSLGSPDLASLAIDPSEQLAAEKEDSSPDE
ncbi:MAG: hypothetical protein AAF483_21640 [Planctomycetota bacterium]